jgi:hypothetical protein
MSPALERCTQSMWKWKAVGANKNWPQLLAAFDHCKRARATLVMAKLDRQSRNVAFIPQLQQSCLHF